MPNDDLVYERVVAAGRRRRRRAVRMASAAALSSTLAIALLWLPDGRDGRVRVTSEATSTSSVDGELQLTTADHGTTIRLRVGDRVRVDLLPSPDGRPPTKYGRLNAFTPTVLQAISSTWDDITGEAHATFEAIAPGEGELWSADSTPCVAPPELPPGSPFACASVLEIAWRVVVVVDPAEP